MIDTLTVDAGTTHRLKLDVFSASCLHRIQAVLRRDVGHWIDKDNITRRALRLYLEYLKKDCISMEDEITQLTKAIEGKE